jgi:hypothetical protein
LDGERVHDHAPMMEDGGGARVGTREEEGSPVARDGEKGP